MFLLSFVVFNLNGRIDSSLQVAGSPGPWGNRKSYGYADTYAHSSYRFNWWGHRIAFDGAAWYWHFVDVVWLFVFIVVYWYGFPVNYFVYAA
jgi:hypothetical protein